VAINTALPLEATIGYRYL